MIEFAIMRRLVGFAGGKVVITGEDAAKDEGLYSRQLYVIGHEEMKKMAASNVLID
jgi:hypothetical protein